MSKRRLDYLVAAKLKVSRSIASSLIGRGKVSVNQHAIKEPDKKFEEDTNINIDYQPQNTNPSLKLEIIYEDEDCVVINKTAGLLTHSKGAFNDEPTVASWLLPKTRGFADNNRGGIIHRLDRATSGVMICAKTPDSLKHFQKQFSSRKVKKIYCALIMATIEPSEAIIDMPIERNPKDPKRFRVSQNGKTASTYYKTLKTFVRKGREFSLLQLKPKTGRTHQLRVHLAYFKHPIIGDTFYGGKPAERLYLHAVELELTLRNGERKIFKANLPDSFLEPKMLADD